LVYNRSLIFIVCLLFNSSAFAVLKDPTRPPNISANSNTSNTPKVELKLSAIFISKQSKHALINGVTAKEGQLILSSVKVLKILKNSVKVRYKGTNQTLYLLTSFKKKQVDIKKSYHNE